MIADPYIPRVPRYPSETAPLELNPIEEPTATTGFVAGTPVPAAPVPAWLPHCAIRIPEFGRSVENDTVPRLEDDVVGAQEVQHMVNQCPRCLQLAVCPGGTRPNRDRLFSRGFQSHGPRLRSRVRRYLRGHPDRRARDLVSRAYRAAVARLEKDTREVEDHAGSQGSRCEANEVYEQNFGVHEKRQRPTRFWVRQGQGRRRDWGRPVFWDHLCGRGRYRPVSSWHTFKNFVTKAAYEVSGAKNRGDFSAIQHLRHSDTISGSMISSK